VITNWENLYYDCGGGAGVLLASIEKPELKQFEGKTVADVAKVWNNPRGHADGFRDRR